MPTSPPIPFDPASCVICRFPLQTENPRAKYCSPECRDLSSALDRWVKHHLLGHGQGRDFKRRLVGVALQSLRRKISSRARGEVI